MLSAMSQPWKPLLEMRLGSDYRAMLIAGSNLSKEDISEKYRGNRAIIGFSIEPKKEFKEKFRTESENQIENVTEYALNSL